MNPYNKALLDNMRLTLEQMGTLPSCRLSFPGERSFLLATGTNAASENWAFVPPPFSEKTVRRVLSFFNETGLPFVWPLLPGADGESSRLLKDAGLPLQGTLVAMTRGVPPPAKNGNFNSDRISDLIFEEAAAPKDAVLWAEIVWRGFDSPPRAPETFIRLAQGLSETEGFSLTLARRGGSPAGAFLLSRPETAPEKSLGVYYFATLPEMRRTGVATAMMEAILRFAAQKAVTLLTLQATPAGVPFYLSRGFEKRFEIPVHSPSPDIF